MQKASNFIVLNIREYLGNDDGRLGDGKSKRSIVRFFWTLIRE